MEIRPFFSIYRINLSRLSILTTRLNYSILNFFSELLKERIYYS